MKTTLHTPILDFLQNYQTRSPARLHMPGHKGHGPLGCEAWDITEIPGADALYEAGGIIAQSEETAGALFGSQATFYSTEGSSQCIRAMLYLALQCRPAGAAPRIVAARNVHKAFVYAAALLDLEVTWLWPEDEGNRSLCACPITAEGLERTLRSLPAPPAAVYVTSPDYLGNLADIPGLAAVCRRRGVPLLVDNAHGAYLKFLRTSLHPLDLGADMTCDSAHKTLPVLTGGAYLHLGKGLPPAFRDSARTALALFGSTSPSYLTLASLDACNAYLAGEPRFQETADALAALKERLTRRGWRLMGAEPLKLTLDANSRGWTGPDLAEHLRAGGVEPEYAGGEACVLMISPETRPEELKRAEDLLLHAEQRPPLPPVSLPPARGEQVLPIRQALFAPQETVPSEEAPGRICGAPTVSCPPAVPIAVSGERIGPEAAALFRRYGVGTVRVVR